ncbi:Membrane bound O-acyl transferase MBOAT [Penicillium viridicatum]|nr:Membrane bound O-acyl transferase MBOAT [Penicillium viridicatum]
MQWLINLLKSLYSLETLDTRFARSTTASQNSARDPSRSSAPRLDKHSPLSGTKPSKWWTIERCVYYLVFVIVVPTMVKQVYDISKPGSPDWDSFSKRLSRGWIPGRQVDNSDAQYANFRDNIPYLITLLILHPLFRKLYGAFWRIDNYKFLDDSNTGLSHDPSPLTVADARLQHRTLFDFAFGIIFLIALHGISAAKVLLIFYTNFNIATRLPRSYVPAATWVFNVGILFANEFCRGYPFAVVARVLLPDIKAAQDVGAKIDSYCGLIPRWEVLFKISILRLISFNLDYYWAQAEGSSNLIEKKHAVALLRSERDRVSYGAALRDFNLKTYFAYTLYSPLYLAGPILSFNDFVFQSRHCLTTTTTVRTFLYCLRFLVALLCMELVLHYSYAVAIVKSSPSWTQYTPYQLAILGYFNLHAVWLKLLIPWRFSRLWALVDGLDAPENMVRCMSNNYSTLAFWRGWHRSLNRWIVRYIYVPLGGNGDRKVKTMVNVLVVFTFIALWHDINLRLLAWGWLTTLFILPEVIAMIIFPKYKWKDWPETFRILCGIGAVGNILMMMVASLVGFVMSVDDVKQMVKGIFAGWSNAGFVTAAVMCLFVSAQIMFEHRKGEKRQGINLKC